jgi:hypothetical protein
MRAPVTTEILSSRRHFLRTSAGAAAIEGGLATRAHAGEDYTIPIVLVGCGGRGTGAASQALSTPGPTKLVAMADVFADRLKSSLDQLIDKHSPQLEVPPERRFLGMEAYKKAIDCVAPGASCSWPRHRRSGRSTSSMPWRGAVMCSWRNLSRSTPRESAGFSRRARPPG